MATMKKANKTAVETTKIVENSTEAVQSNNDPVEQITMTKTVVAPAERVFKETDPITCVSITSGELGMIGIKSHINYTWAGRGDETDVEYQDLVAAIRSSKKHIYEPYFIITDEDFLKKFPQVEKVYASMYSIKDLESVFNASPDEMERIIQSLPKGAQESIKNIASTKIAKGTLDSIKKIQKLDKIFDTKFMLMTELFS